MCTGSRATMPVGRKLHVCVVDAAVTGADLVPNELYEYDVSITTTDGTQNLAGLGLLSGQYPLGYTAGRLPTFALPPQLSQLKIVHGSCRKPSGEGIEMLSVVDAMLYRDYLDPLERAHQLLLTGDQIYADDVAPGLLVVFQDTAKLLLDWSEPEMLRLPDNGVSLAADDPRLVPGPSRERFQTWHKPVDPTTPATRQQFSDFESRMEFMFTQTDLSSNECDAHLVFLGEFFSHYLMAWSPELWPRDAAGHFQLPGKDDIKASWNQYAETTENTYRREKYLTEITARNRNALAYGATVAKVRRALANVPTYMIFDDHEITDDWNLDRAWNENVMMNSAGRQIIRNGLIGYSIFQDWGNVPERYESGPAAAIHAAATMDLTTLKPPVVSDADTVNVALNLLPWTLRVLDFDSVMRWDYVAYGPDHQILFLDARNWRSFDANDPNAKAAPQLIARDILDIQFDTGRFDPNRALIVIAPAPVFGILPVEFAQAKMSKGDEGQIEENDRESWGSNESGLALLLQRLVVFQRVLLLSGDVHYAFAKKTTFFRRTSAGFDKARILQLCCSSLKNEIPKTRLLQRVGTTPVSWPFAEELAPQEYGAWQEMRTRVERHFQQAAYDAPATDPARKEMLWRTYADVRISNFLAEPLAIIVDLGPEYRAAQDIIDSYSTTWATSKVWEFHCEGVPIERDIQIVDGTLLQVQTTTTRETRAREAATNTTRFIVGRNNIGRITFSHASTSHTPVVQTLYYAAPEFGADRLLEVQQIMPFTIPLDSER